MHLADAFIQSNLKRVFLIHIIINNNNNNYYYY